MGKRSGNLSLSPVTPRKVSNSPWTQCQTFCVGRRDATFPVSGESLNLLVKKTSVQCRHTATREKTTAKKPSESIHFHPGRFTFENRPCESPIGVLASPSI